MDGTVLIADDDRTIRTVLTQALSRAGCRVHATGSLTTLKRWVEEGRGDLVISDVVMPDGNGLAALPEISRLRPDLPVIIISAQNNIMTAIKAAEAEAFDYLPKPFDLPDLMKRVHVGLKQKRMPQLSPEKPAIAQTLPLVGHSPVMQELYRLVARIMNTSLPVLIQGESGTGKSLIAHALHDFSDRRDLPFIIANADDCSTSQDIAAFVSRAQRGTLLFDEVGDLTPEAQTRLTRQLDGLGDAAPRIISTSQQDLSATDFRDDLFFRLSGAIINVPKLRDRIDDVTELAEHFLTRAVQDGHLQRHLNNEAADKLRTCLWPGNIRQLENTMRRLSITGTDPEISAQEVMDIIGNSTGGLPELNGNDKGLGAAVAVHVMRYFELHGDSLPPAGLYDRILHEVELPLIEIALDATGGNQAKCADLLGINRNTLRKKLTALGIEVTRRRKLM